MKTETAWIAFDLFGIITYGAILMCEQLKKSPAPPANSLKTKVWAMLDDGVQVNPEIEDWSVDDIVIDLIAFADDVVETHDELRPHVITWKDKRRRFIA